MDGKLARWLAIVFFMSALGIGTQGCSASGDDDDATTQVGDDDATGDDDSTGDDDTTATLEPVTPTLVPVTETPGAPTATPVVVSATPTPLVASATPTPVPAGTPTPTPVPPTGVTVYAIQDPSNADFPGLDTRVRVTGVVVTTPMIRASSDSVNPDGFWVQEPEGGVYSGIFVFARDLGVEVTEGDVVDLVGTYREFYGNSQIEATEVVVTGSADVPAPMVVSVGDVYDGSETAEQYEGVLVQVESAEVTNADLGYGVFGVSQGDVGELYVSPTFDRYWSYEPQVGDTFATLIGVMEYAYSHYRLAPRSCDDMAWAESGPVCEPKVCPEGPISIMQVQDRDDPDAVSLSCDVSFQNVVVTSPVADYGSSAGFFVEEPEGGAWSGVYVYARGLDLSGIEPGSVVDLTGIYQEYHDLTEIAATSVTRTGSGDVPAPVEVAVGDIGDGGDLSETYEGVLVVVRDVVVVDPAYGEDETEFIVAAQSDLTQQVVVGWMFEHDYTCPSVDGVPCNTDQRRMGQRIDSITGVLTYSWGHFKIEPRSADDIVNGAGVDTDLDGLLDDDDNCPFEANPDQADTDGDGVGDLCDNCPSSANVSQADGDEDGVGDLCDNCPQEANPDQGDVDEDNVGDVCDADADGDDVGQGNDNCPLVPNPDQSDVDGDGVGDACDNCMSVPNPDQANADGDMYGDACDNCPDDAGADLTDTDGDGIGDLCDNCPEVPNPDQTDSNGNGYGDECDIDWDADGVPQGDGTRPCTEGATTGCDDNCPDVANSDQADADGDGLGDVCDNCPDQVNPDQADLDGDGMGNACDTDWDDDGIEQGHGENPCTGGNTEDCDDNCPYMPNPDQADADGDGIGDDCHILLTEICVKPLENEFVEIFNPSWHPVDLSDYYLWNANSTTLVYYEIASAAEIGGSDFAARFPAGTTIESGQYLTIAIDSMASFIDVYGIAPDFVIKGEYSGDTRMMEPAFSGSIAANSTLSNSGEDMILFYWDGSSDLVQDVDYLLWGDTTEAVDKTGVTVGSSTYLPDTPVDQQVPAPAHDALADDPTTWRSTQRVDYGEGTEKRTGGNGITGHDETSENMNVTWQSMKPATPGGPPIR